MTEVLESIGEIQIYSMVAKVIVKTNVTFEQ